jgi:hypothetical protein
MEARLLVKSLVDAVGNHADGNGVLDAARYNEVWIYPLAMCFVTRLNKCWWMIVDQIGAKDVLDVCINREIQLNYALFESS